MNTQVDIKTTNNDRETFTKEEILERRGIYVKEREIDDAGNIPSSTSRFVTVASSFGSNMVTLFIQPSGTVERMNEDLHNYDFVEVDEEITVTLSNTTD